MGRGQEWGEKLKDQSVSIQGSPREDRRTAKPGWELVYKGVSHFTVAQLAGRLPANQGVAGLIPGQGTCLVC